MIDEERSFFAGVEWSVGELSGANPNWGPRRRPDVGAGEPGVQASSNTTAGLFVS
jgi:hypothetical protein